MATRTLLRAGVRVSRLTRPQIHINRYFSSVQRPQALAGLRPPASSPVRLQQRTASTIPEDFDVDLELPESSGSAKIEDVPASPFPESATLGVDDSGTDWSRSYHGLSETPFEKEISDILLAPIDPADVEMKPGNLIIYTVYTLLLSDRWPYISTGDQIPPYLESRLWTWRLGPCTTQ
jgi:Mitochondrial genome maintenance MGM101